MVVPKLVSAGIRRTVKVRRFFFVGVLTLTPLLFSQWKLLSTVSSRTVMGTTKDEAELDLRDLASSSSSTSQRRLHQSIGSSQSFPSSSMERLVPKPNPTTRRTTTDTTGNDVASLETPEWPLHLTPTLEEAVMKQLDKYNRNSNNGNDKRRIEKPFVMYCSKQIGKKYFLEMLFPNIGSQAIAFDKVKTERLPPWSAPTFLLVSDGKKECVNHPWYQEALQRRAESPRLAVPRSLEHQWVGGVHWPANSTLGMRMIKDRPMLVQIMGEVFWREKYGSMDDVDLAIWRAKEAPRSGTLTLHDIQGASHIYRPDSIGRTMYTSAQAKQIWTGHDSHQNPFRYDAKDNHKGFCALLTRGIFQKNYDMEALVRSAMLRLLSEYKPCVRPTPEECKGNDLNSHECLSGYKFVISMDNTQLEGYVSEKVFLGKLAGGVPIYSGAPDVANYVNTDSFVWCPLEPSFIREFRTFLVDPPGKKPSRKLRVFRMFNTTVKETDQEKLLDWAVEYLRPHLAPCVERIIGLDKDDEQYNAIQNAPLITDPEILNGYASKLKGLGLAYRYLSLDNTTAK